MNAPGHLKGRDKLYLQGSLVSSPDCLQFPPQEAFPLEEVFPPHSFVLPFAVGCGRNHNVAHKQCFFSSSSTQACAGNVVLQSAPESFKR